MRRTMLLIALFALSAASRLHAFEDAPPARNRGPLARAIRLEELPENRKDSRLPLAFGTEPQDVDINSTIWIHVSKEDLVQSLATGSLSADEALLVRASEDLKAASGFLFEAIEAAEEFSRGLQSGKSKAKLTQLAAADDARLDRTFALMESYVSALQDSQSLAFQQHAEEALAREEKAFLSKSRFQLAAYIAEEIKWMAGQLADTRKKMEAESSKVALLLSVVHVRDKAPVEVGVEYYNNLPIGTPKSIDRLTLVPSPEDLAKMSQMEAQAQEMAKILNQAIQESTELREVLSQLLAARGIDLSQLEEAIEQLKSDATQLQSTDWGKIGERVEKRLREALEEAAEDEREALESSILPKIGELRTQARNLRTSLVGLLARVNLLATQIEETGEPKDPASALASLLTLVQAGADAESVFDDLGTDLDRWEKAAEELHSTAGEIESALDDLPEELQDAVKSILTSEAQEQLGDLVTHLQELRGAADEVAKGVKSLIAEMRGAADLAIALDTKPPSTSFVVPLSEVKDTWVDLRTLNPRSDDDLVIVRAWLFRTEPGPDDKPRILENQELDRVFQHLRLLRFGWYSSPGVGVVYLSSVDEIEQVDEDDGDEQSGQEPDLKETRAFAPLVSWLFRHRAWREPQSGSQPFPEPFRYRSRWYESIAFGLHTVALDLNSDNEQELGLGVSLSFFDGLLQFGGGWDLSLGDEPYVFIGTRLLDVFRNMGVSNKPAAPAE